MKKLNSYGFSAAELLIALPVLAIFGSAFHFVDQQNEQSKPNVVQAPILATYPKDIPAPETKPEDKRYVYITQWGVKGAHTGIYSLYYELDRSEEGDVADFRSTAVMANRLCPNFSSFGSIVRSSTQVHTSDKQIGEFYYYYSENDIFCSEEEGAAALQREAKATVQKVFESLEAI